MLTSIRMTQPTIAECMTAAPYTIGDDQTLLETRKRMTKWHVRHLPVLFSGRLVGLISDRDVDIALSADRERTSLVSDLMIESVYVAAPTEKVSHVVRTMMFRKLGAAVIAEQAKVLGVFTTTDALRLLAEKIEE